MSLGPPEVLLERSNGERLPERHGSLSQRLLLPRKTQKIICGDEQSTRERPSEGRQAIVRKADSLPMTLQAASRPFLLFRFALREGDFALAQLIARTLWRKQSPHRRRDSGGV